MTAETLTLLAMVWTALALPTFAMLFFIVAPFGRHANTQWGPTVDNRVGWVLMELPSLAIMLWFLLFGTHSREGYTWVLFALWIAHYTNRVVIFPWRLRTTGKRMPWVIVLCAVLFNLMNAGLNGHWLAEFAPTYGDAWLRSPSFIAGLALFALGAWINVKSDNMLIALRAPGETGYKIPRGFLFNYVSAPNLFGEMVEWAGFALMAWNWPALSFLVWTVANLLPRAVAHHAWYRARFADYPPERKAVVPWVW